jgi:hypothetical protein
MSAWVLLATATIAALKLGKVVGDQFFVDAKVTPTDGEAIEVKNLPFVHKKQSHGQDQYQPKHERRSDLGIASLFTIVESDYETLRRNKTITIPRPKSRYTIKLTLVPPE